MLITVLNDRGEDMEYVNLVTTLWATQRFFFALVTAGTTRLLAIDFATYACDLILKSS